jgi:hypothetical protein
MSEPNIVYHEDHGKKPRKNEEYRTVAIDLRLSQHNPSGYDWNTEDIGQMVRLWVQVPPERARWLSNEDPDQPIQDAYEITDWVDDNCIPQFEVHQVTVLPENEDEWEGFSESWTG